MNKAAIFNINEHVCLHISCTVSQSLCPVRGYQNFMPKLIQRFVANDLLLMCHVEIKLAILSNKNILTKWFSTSLQALL